MMGGSSRRGPHPRAPSRLLWMRDGLVDLGRTLQSGRYCSAHRRRTCAAVARRARSRASTPTPSTPSEHDCTSGCAPAPRIMASAAKSARTARRLSRMKRKALRKIEERKRKSLLSPLCLAVRSDRRINAGLEAQFVSRNQQVYFHERTSSKNLQKNSGASKAGTFR